MLLDCDLCELIDLEPSAVDLFDVSIWLLRDLAVSPEKFLEELLLAETDLDAILLDVDVLVMLLDEVDLDVMLLDVAVLEKLLLFADADLIEELLLVEADLAEMLLADKDLVLAMDGREFT